MNSLKFDLTCRRKSVSIGKIILKKDFIGLIFILCVLMANASIVYFNHTSWINAIFVGVMISCFLFTLITWLMAYGDLKSEQSLLEHLEKWDIDTEQLESRGMLNYSFKMENETRS